MTIAASGEISLGVNADVTRSVACELALDGTTQICMNQSQVRSLAGRASGSICFANFYGKSGPPSVLGQEYQGGYYTGTVTIESAASYYLIVSPNSGGCAACQWMTSPRTTAPNTNCFCDGYRNTYTGMAPQTTRFPAGNFTATRTLNGYSDWYLPARVELFTLWANRGSMPGGQGYATPGTYWTSTEDVATQAYRLSTFDGGQGSSYKGGSCRVRSLRRVPL